MRFLSIIFLVLIIGCSNLFYMDIKPKYNESIIQSSENLDKEIINSENEVVKYDVDFSMSEDGIIKVLYDTPYDKKTKLVIQNDNNRYVYNLSKGSEYTAFPLQLGSGEYEIMIYESIDGYSFEAVYNIDKEVEIINEFGVYLSSVQEVNWDDEDIAIQLAYDIAKYATEENIEDGDADGISDEKIIDSIYSYIINNIVYDDKKIDNLEHDYIPNIDKVLEDGSGICYDYSVLLASMLRSQGIPTKLVKGYTTNTDVYHAWNEIYLESEERWIIVDSTYDAYMEQNGYEYNREKPVDEYIKSKEY